MKRSWFHRLRQAFIEDRQGGVMIEFAFMMPILVFVMLAGVDLVRFAMLQQKLSRAAVTLADVTSQYQSLSVAQVDQIFDAVTYVIAPFPLGPNGQVIISSISKTGTNPVVVDWQRFGPGTASAVSNYGVAGGNATLPAGFTVNAGESAVVAEVFYDFTPLLFPQVLPPRRVEHSSLFRPRFDALSTLAP